MRFRVLFIGRPALGGGLPSGGVLSVGRSACARRGQIAAAHYETLDSLGLTAQESMAIGGEVGDRVQASLLSVVFRVAKGSGVTPWTACPMYPRPWERMFLGGDCRVVKLGPKEARFDNFGVPLCRYDYFRSAWRGMAHAALSLFSRKVFVNEVQSSRTSTGFAFRASWV